MANIWIYIRNRTPYYNGSTRINVEGPKEIKHKSQATGFKCYTHTIPELGGTKQLLFVIATGNTPRGYTSLKFYENGVESQGKLEYTPGNGVNKNIYIYFYNEDPRPLLICYQHKAYKPSSKSDYDNNKWTKDSKITTCVCMEVESDPNVLESLVKVVGYLNTVNLNEYPRKCNGDDNSNKEYEVHTSQNKKIQIKVTCQPVKPPDKSCYRKVIHTHAGIERGNGSGFRLGNIIHKEEKNKLDYMTISEDHKYNPLKSVTAYFYDHDTGYDDPLMVELEFKLNGEGIKKTEYYRLSSTGSIMIWEKDPTAETIVQKGGKNLLGYLDKIRYNLKQALKVEINRTGGQYKVQLSEIKGGHGSFTPLNNGGNKQITVSEAPSCESLKNNGYKCFKHDLTSLGPDVHHQIGGLKFYIPGKESGQEMYLKLLEPESSARRTGETLDSPTTQALYNKCMGDIFVYFYQGVNPTTQDSSSGQGDPRPLLICYGTTVYSPKGRENYFEQWIRDENVKFPIDPSGNNENILNALTKAVGFLNVVQLNIHPSKCNGNDLQSNTSQYDVHTFQGKPIKVKVECQQVSGTPPAKSCYRKLIHKPAGMQNSKDGKGYRLGDLIYSGSKGRPFNVPYNKGVNKYYPLSQVIVYFYKEDSAYRDPLLVELEFKVNGGGGIKKEYYKLTTRDTSKVEWNHDKEVQSEELSDSNKLVTYLDGIRYNLKKVLKILIDNHGPYDLMISQELGGTGTFTPLHSDSKEIRVSVSEDTKCSELKNSNYKCYKHELSKVTDQLEDIGGVKFYITGQGGNDIEIPVFRDNDDNGDLKLPYNKCTGDMYVFFYNRDSVPLLIFYNKMWFRPFSRNDYLEAWITVSGLKDFEPCKSGDNKKLIVELNRVNRMLNQIDLEETSNYGLVKTEEPRPLISTDRVNVTDKSPSNKAYKRYVHRAVNYFTIGAITHKGQDITQGNGIAVNGTNIKGEDKQGPFLSKNNPNTVVVYYSINDIRYQLPQLILVMQTDRVEDDTEPVKASPRTSYGYYILSSGSGGLGYQYTWSEVEDTDSQLILDEATEFKLLNAAVILVDKKTQYTEGDIKTAITGVKPKLTSPGNPSDINRLIQKTISVSPNGSGIDMTCVSRFGYKVYTHDISGVLGFIADVTLITCLRFFILSKDTGEGYKEVTLFNTYPDPGYGECQQVEYLYHSKGHHKVYVYFYGSDPRHLLLCYNGNTYRPRKENDPIPDMQVIVDYSTWIKVYGISHCGCVGREIDGNKDLLEALEQVVGYLNPVQLNPKQVPSSASSIITTEKPLEPPSTESVKAEYLLHKYTPNITIKMKLTSQDVECYKKYIYEPNGTQDNGTGFRLGDVVYSKDGEGIDPPIGTLNYNTPTSTTEYKYHPLMKVIVYYYDDDTSYEDPLLVELVFETGAGSPPGSNKTEYYKLITRNEKTIMWAKSEKQQKDLSDSNKLVTYLDGIRYNLKKVLKILIDNHGPYDLMISQELGGTGTFTPLHSDSKEIRVSVSEDTKCSELKNSNYKCYKHELSKVTDQLEDIGGVKFYITGQGGNDIEISIFNTENTDEEEEGQEECFEDEIELDNELNLPYNKCTGDVYVFFYKSETVPLLISYNQRWFSYISRDGYFNLWIEETSLHCVKEPCSKTNQHDNCKLLKKALEMVNRNLNQIDLDPEKATLQGYGIPEPEGQVLEKLDLIRVKVTLQKNNANYNRIVHRTSNSFTIGDICFEGGNISYEGIKINGESITVDGKLTSFIDFDNKPNTVVVYYSINDIRYQLPQLILVMQTDRVEDDTEPVKASPRTSYGYYILCTKDSGLEYEYKWRQSTYGTLQKRLTLVDETEFELFNSAVILLEKGQDGKNQYADHELQPAINSANIGSPGNNDSTYGNLNRLTKKQVKVADEKESECKCLKDTGFKVIAHNIENLVKPVPPIGNTLSNFSIISGLRFLIPTKEGNGRYKELTLCPSSTTSDTEGSSNGKCGTSGKVDRLYHKQGLDKICVYFYGGTSGKGEGGDPRPLMVCYDDKFYRPQDLATYSEKWVKVEGVDTCDCTVKDNCDSLLKALVCVSNFLNPVNILKVPSNGAQNTSASCEYQIHRFNGQEIKITVTLTPASNGFCYDRYTHKHMGTGSGGDGFRLGRIDYGPKGAGPKEGRNCIQVNEKSSWTCINAVLEDKLPEKKYLGADEVVVYYYKGDSCLRNPLLVALKGNGKHQPYYELLRGYGRRAEAKRYKKIDEKIELDDRADGELKKKLDKILWDNTVTEVCHKKLSPGGYRCYKVSNSGYIDSKDSITFYIWPGQAHTVTINSLSQNGCHCYIYVYFYGDDPRPLLLCYNGDAYKPTKMDQYAEQWTKVNGGVKFVCTDRGFDAKSLLEQLYSVSMFMNPVDLKQTKELGKKVVEFYKEQRGKQGEPGKEPTHRYQVHDFGPNPVNVTITGLDLNCYKRYTHRPPLGYRLGEVEWATGAASGITYDSHKQLISVSLYYYMYDKDHLNPLLVELGFKGELSEYYRLKDKVVNGTSDKEPPKWEKITANGTAGGQGGNGDSQELKEDDAEFIREAHRIEGLMNVWDRGIPHFPGDYWSLYRELQELIEAKAYRVRTKLGIKYTRVPANLILATEENCMEESIMVYLVGGGG